MIIKKGLIVMGRHARTKQECLAHMAAQVKVTSSGCHEWQRALDTQGYAQIHFQGRFWKVHRLVWTFTNGDIPKGLVLCHKCDNPKCVNPDHIFLGTQADNMRDAISKDRFWPAKLTYEQVDAIRKEVPPSGRGASKIARKYGVSPSTISNVIKNKTYCK